MFGSFLPSLWSSSNQSLLGSREPTLLCNQVPQNGFNAANHLRLRCRGVCYLHVLWNIRSGITLKGHHPPTKLLDNVPSVPRLSPISLKKRSFDVSILGSVVRRASRAGWAGRLIDFKR